MAVVEENKNPWKEIVNATVGLGNSQEYMPKKAAPGTIITDYNDLPNRNWEILFGGMPNTPAGKKLREEYPKLSNAFNGIMYLQSAAEHPQNKPELAISAINEWLDDKWPLNGLSNWLGWTKDEDEKDFDPWEQEYLGWEDRNGAGGAGAYDPLAGNPFPSIGGYAPDWKTLREASNIEAPKYHEQAFNPMNTVANMLMNMDWINMDMSRAGRVMQDAFNRRAADNANVANKNEEAKYNAARDKLNTALAFEELRAKSAQQAAQLAIERWKSMQPKPLGGNKMYWRDSNGGLHFEAIDKQGEARTLGGNEAIAKITSLDEKALKKLSDEDIIKMAKRGSLLLQDKAAQVPWMQGFILQAQMMKNSRRGEK